MPLIRRLVQQALCHSVHALTFLLAGIAISVAIAWGCAYRFSKHRGAAQLVVVRSGGHTRDVGIALWDAPGSVLIYPTVSQPRANPSANWRTIPRSAVAWSHSVTEAIKSGCSLTIEGAGGWPFLCLRWQRSRYPDDPWTILSGLSLRAPGPLEFSDGAFVSTATSTDALPLIPIPIGLIANSVVYGTCSYLLVNVTRSCARALMQRSRIRRGVCPSCAYPLQAGQRCPECGQKM
jgi:hypothetical protein